MEVALHELGEIFTGNTPSKKNKNYWNSEDTVFIKPNDLNNNNLLLNDKNNEYISKEALAQARIVGRNSILVTCIGTIGKIAITTDAKTAFNQQINAIVPNKNVYTKYLAYALMHYKPRLAALANAPVVPIINKKQFSNFKINLNLDKEIQYTVIRQLDLVGEIIKNKNRQLSKLDELIKARFVEMFGDPVIEQKFKDKYSMTEVCQIIDGDRGKNYPHNDDFSNSGYCLFLNAKNVTTKGFNFENQMYISQKKDSELKKGKLRRGDIVLTTRGTIGNLAFYDSEIPFKNIRINSGMVIIRLDANRINEMFFIEQFKMQLFKVKQKIASGTAQPQLPISTMNNIKILLPPLSLQNEFANFVHQVDKSKVAVQKSLDETQRLFDSLMQEYFG